jgi:oligopeptide transport system substrate-binding protein
MEPLYHRSPDGSVEAAGALTHTISPDGRVYTLTLRTNARWADGEVVTAQHYTDGFLYELDECGGAPGAGYVEGAEDYATGVITDPAQVGVRAVSSYTLVFTLTNPVGFFPRLMASSYPIRQDIVDQYGDQWTEPGNFVGNGPYVLTQWDHGDQLILEKNDLYYDAAQATIEQLNFQVIPDRGDRVTAYENDLLDVASPIPSGELPRILSDPVLSGEFHRAPRPGVYYLGMNTQLTPTNNVSVCKALASAIDRSYILTDVLNSPWKEGATSVIPPELPDYQGDAVGYTYDVTQAQAYLAQAGYTDGVGFPSIELWANGGGRNELVINAVAEMWRDNLGITVTTYYPDWNEYLDYLFACHDDPGACDYNAYRLGWLIDYADANNVLNDLFHPDSWTNFTGWDDARYRELISMTVTETNQISRTAYFQEADQILVEEDVAVIPLFFYDQPALIKSDVLYEYLPALGGPYYMNWRITMASTGTITDTGGTVTSPDGDTAVDFPDEAVSDTINVTYTQFYLPPHPPTSTFGFAGNGFKLEAVDVSSGEEITTFAEPLTVVINYTDGDLNGQDEDTLELTYWDGSAWSTEGITIVDRDTVNNRFVAEIEHLTDFALFGKYRIYLPLTLRNW